MSAIAWTAIEKALHAWVVAATGLAASNVIWAYEKGARPAPPYVALAITDIDPIGHDWVVYDDAPDPAPGAELRVRARGHRLATLQLQCFAAEGSGNEPLRVIADALAGLALHEYSLDAAGVGIGEIESGRLLEGRRGGILEPRAVAEVNLHLSSEVEGRETYVETADVQITEADIGVVADLDLQLGDPP